MLKAIGLAASSSRSVNSSTSSQLQYTLVGPAVRLLLHDYQIDPKGLKASGPKGNLLKSDVLTHISRSQLKPKPQKVSSKSELPSIKSAVSFGSKKRHVRQRYEDLPLINKEQLKNITEAHYSLTSELVVDDLLREIENAGTKSGNALHSIESREKAFNEFVRRASTLACERVPQAHLNIEPLISVSQHSVHHGTNEGRLHSNEFQVSNLGIHDSVEHFTPVGQPSSETYTLAIGRTKKRVVLADDEIKYVTTVKVTFSCDHRAVESTIGAEWFKYFKQFMEHPHSIFI